LFIILVEKVAFFDGLHNFDQVTVFITLSLKDFDSQCADHDSAALFRKSSTFSAP